ncbi:MAG: histidine kinase, partial [Eubacteriales bacterium]|nr:histidine kinase [Eubacteriales bacterium]
RGLSYADAQTGAARRMRSFHIGVLCFVLSEYLLWTVGCFWPDTSLASPVFWCDMLLTLAILGLLPATRRAVRT